MAGTSTIGAQVVWAVRNEMALHLTDVVFRRTDLASAGDPGRSAISEAAQIMGAEMGWTSRRVDVECEQVLSSLPNLVD
jgi:glycerol-3-phosphate dehydrogenase